MNSSFKVIRSRYAEAEICSLQVLLAFAHQLQTFVLSPSFSFDLLLLHPLQKLSWVPCLNIYELCEAHWGLNACWILIQKINPEQEIREWGLPCRRSDTPAWGESCGEGQSQWGQGPQSTRQVCCLSCFLLRLGLVRAAHPMGLHPLKGSLPNCRSGAQTRGRSSTVPKEIVKFESNSPSCC